MALQGEVELGIEVYALATSYPYLGNSIYWEDSVGKQMAKFAEGIPEEARIAAIERGKKRDLQKTVRELYTWIRSSPKFDFLPCHFIHYVSWQLNAALCQDLSLCSTVMTTFPFLCPLSTYL